MLKRYAYAEIGGASRGFLFLHICTDFYLWNPSTGVHKQIPPSLVSIVCHDDNSIFMYDFCMFLNGNVYWYVLKAKKKKSCEKTSKAYLANMD